MPNAFVASIVVLLVRYTEQGFLYWVDGEGVWKFAHPPLRKIPPVDFPAPTKGLFSHTK